MTRCRVQSQMINKSAHDEWVDERDITRLRCSLDEGHEGKYHPLVPLPRCGIVNPDPGRGPVVGQTCVFTLDDDGRCPEHGPFTTWHL